MKQKSQEISTVHITPGVPIIPFVIQYWQSFLVEMPDFFNAEGFFFSPVICVTYESKLYFPAPCSGSNNCPFVCWPITWSCLLQCWK